jgi:molybdate transport system substrate-binding protein
MAARTPFGPFTDGRVYGDIPEPHVSPRGQLWWGAAGGYSSPVRRLPLLLIAVLAGSCTRSHETRTLTVFAAASLAEAFRELERAYEAEHPSIDVELNFAGTQLLATQLLEGATAQVFASADVPQLDRVAAEFELLGRRSFASNRIVIVVPAGSAITGVGDLTKPGVRVVMAGEAVPAGRYARLALEQYPVDSIDMRAAVEQNLVSNEDDVRGVVAKVRLGEADAGFVYATDVVSDPKLEIREILVEVPARYEIAVIAEHSRDELGTAAMEFVEFVTSPAGQAILSERAFGPPLP